MNSNTLVEKFKVGNLDVEIHRDDDPQNPRGEGWADRLGTMLCWHGRYELGDVKASKDATKPDDLDLTEEYKDDNGEWQERDMPYVVKSAGRKGYDTVDIWETYEEYLKQQHDAAVVLPLYLYDHSGITMKIGPFGDRWDSGQVGFIFVTNKKLKEEGMTVEQATTCLKGEVEEYDQYLTGDVYGFVITDQLGTVDESCWGFFGQKYCEEEARSIAEAINKHAANTPIKFINPL